MEMKEMAAAGFRNDPTQETQEVLRLLLLFIYFFPVFPPSHTHVHRPEARRIPLCHRWAISVGTIIVRPARPFLSFF